MATIAGKHSDGVTDLNWQTPTSLQNNIMTTYSLVAGTMADYDWTSAGSGTDTEGLLTDVQIGSDNDTWDNYLGLYVTDEQLSLALLTGHVILASTPNTGYDF